MTSVAFKENIRVDGKSFEIYEGVICIKNFKVNSSKKIFGNLFELKKYYKDQSDEVMELLVELLMNSLYGEQIRKDIEEEYTCKSEYWMLTEYDGRVKENWSIGSGDYIVKLAEDESKKDDKNEAIVMPVHLGAFLMSNTERNMINFVEAIGGFKTNDVYYGDTDSLSIETLYSNKLEELGLFGKNKLRGKNDYIIGGVRNALFLAHKRKYCLSTDDYGIISEHKTFKCYSNANRNLDRKEFFKLFDGEKLVTKQALS